jgi:hypothetical protein
MACGTVEKLRQRLGDWRWIAGDALTQARAISQSDWNFVRKHRKTEGEEAIKVNELGGAILMPEVMLRVSMVAYQFKVPWGLAFNRLWEGGRMREEDGQVVWIEAKGAQQ